MDQGLKLIQNILFGFKKVYEQVALNYDNSIGKAGCILRENKSSKDGVHKRPLSMTCQSHENSILLALPANFGKFSERIKLKPQTTLRSLANRILFIQFVNVCFANKTKI